MTRGCATLLQPLLVQQQPQQLEYVTMLQMLVMSFVAIKMVKYLHFVSTELEVVANALSEPKLGL